MDTVIPKIQSLYQRGQTIYMPLLTKAERDRSHQKWVSLKPNQTDYLKVNH